jgi:2-polyprenyl-3-methyl-5-hydroxy-6-metoxy-1,4-benzoquinol methylase
MTTDLAVARGLLTKGESEAAIYEAAATLLRRRSARGPVVDVGCGIGRFLAAAGDLATGYVGIDVVRHPGLAPDVSFVRADLDREPIPLGSASADIVVALETIEHLENPRRFCRELSRILKPGGWLVVSTPNQLSVLSLLSLTFRGRFAAFPDVSYPVHCTALLPNDLVRMSRENDLSEVELAFTGSGRIPLTRAHYPPAVSRLLPQAFSDNVLLIARGGGGARTDA